MIAMVECRGSWINLDRLKAIAKMLAMAMVPFALMVGPAASQFNRGPSITNLNVGPRLPNVNMSPTLSPNIRYSPNLDSDGGPQGSPPASLKGRGGAAQSGGGPDRRATSSSVDPSFVAREVVVEIDGVVTDQQAAAITRRHRITRVEALGLPLIGSTLVRWRIPDGRSVAAVVRELTADTTIKSAQPNFRFTLQQQSQVAPFEGDPAQYALAKLHLPEAHLLSRGEDVTVAIVDSGIDAGHPELAGAIVSSFDAIGSKEGAHPHGTGVAGVIASHARLMGAAPAARIMAIRAFGGGDHAVGTSFAILKSLDYAVAQGARIINMSFAGPQDPLLAKGVAAAAARGSVLVAASGNAGAKSPPLFPAADSHVIAVSALDAADKIFPASNRGAYLAISAPGAEILTAAPDGKFQVTSGTSFAAAYVSGVAALMIAHNRALSAEDVRAILLRTARDLGAPGRDDVFGAGELDALKAVTTAAVPVATASEAPGAGGAADPSSGR